MGIERYGTKMNYCDFIFTKEKKQSFLRMFNLQALSYNLTNIKQRLIAQQSVVLNYTPPSNTRVENYLNDKMSKQNFVVFHTAHYCNEIN